jgi:hypothetical protein
MTTKSWYASKAVWLGIILTLSGIVPAIVELLNKTAITPADVVLAFGGVLGVILRIWFTNTTIATPPTTPPEANPPAAG